MPLPYNSSHFNTNLDREIVYHTDTRSSMVTASIVLLYVSYSIPVICLLVKGRENIRHGPFWFKRFGLFSNVVLLCWTLFTVVMYSLPALMPVRAGSKFKFQETSLYTATYVQEPITNTDLSLQT